MDGDTLRLSFRNSSMELRVADELADPRGRAPVESAVEKAYDVKLKVVIVGRDEGGPARKAQTAMDSPLVRAAVTMGARIVDEGAVSDTTDSDPEATPGQPGGDRPG